METSIQVKIERKENRLFLNWRIDDEDYQIECSTNPDSVENAMKDFGYQAISKIIHNRIKVETNEKGHTLMTTFEPHSLSCDKHPLGPPSKPTMDVKKTLHLPLHETEDKRYDYKWKLKK